MQKKILASMMVIGLVATLAGAGLYAYFSDTEKSTGNVFTAGTLDIAVNGENPWASAAFEFTDVKPSEELLPVEVLIENVGQNPGHVSWYITYVEKDKDWTGEFSGDGWDMTADEFAKLVFVKDVKFNRDCDDIYEPLGDDGESDYWTWIGDDHVQLTEDKWWTYTDEERREAIERSEWPGAPGGIDDEWVLPDWIRWADYVHGNKDGYLSIYEIATAPSWDIDDPGTGAAGPTTELDPGDSYKHKVWLHLGDSLGADDFILTGVEDNKPQADGIEITITIEFSQVP